MLLESDAPDSFVRRAARAGRDEHGQRRSKLAEVNAVKTRAEQAKLALDAEVREQQKQTDLMAKEKTRGATRRWRWSAGRASPAVWSSATSPVARDRPRAAPPTAAGSRESCSENDPTTSGCVTPRTLHTYKEVKRAGFNRFVGCYRPGGPWEHPKGQACDWSLQKSGFSPWHNNDTRMYGNNVAAFLIRNADRLGIYYVIWNRQIWFPATGWKSYSGPSNHTDHVHMSLL